MVFRSEMALTNHEQRPKALHNFPLPNLWGNRRHLKFMKIDSSSSDSGDHRIRRRSLPLKFVDSFIESDHRRLRNASLESDGEEGIAEFRVKIMSDLKTMRDQITQSLFKRDDIEEKEEINVSGSIPCSVSGSSSGEEKETEITPVKPWNLRKRKATSISGNHENSLNQNSRRFVTEEKIVMNPSRNGVVEAETKKKRPKFSVMLTKKEIEEDFKTLLGHRPPRRPKKRPRTVQKEIDNLYPGLYLTEVTLDLYDVP